MITDQPAITMITDKTVGIVNKLITQGLFVFPHGLVQMGGWCWQGRGCSKGLSSIPGCTPLSLALSSPIKPTTPQQYGAINYRRAAINAAQRREAGTHKQDKRPHKRPAAFIPSPFTQSHRCCSNMLRKSPPSLPLRPDWGKKGQTLHLRCACAAPM